MNTLMTASWYLVAKLLIVSRMSKVDYRKKVLPASNIHLITNKSLVRIGHKSYTNIFVNSSKYLKWEGYIKSMHFKDRI